MKNVKQIVAAPCVNTALYIRVACKDDQAVENQKLFLNGFITDRPEFRLYDTYTDNGLAGTNFHRPNFQRLLSDIEAGYINCVIVKDLARLGRNYIDVAYCIDQYFAARNVRFIAVTDRLDTGNGDSGMFTMINGLFPLDIGKRIAAQFQPMAERRN